MDAGSTHEPTREVRADRRARQPRLYTFDQLVGREPIRLRRRSDKVRLTVHIITVLLLGILIAWWVLPRHAFAGPVIVDLATGRGIHVGDLPVFGFLAVAARSLRVVTLMLRNLLG